jgi:hypothetical protein
MRTNWPTLLDEKLIPLCMIVAAMLVGIASMVAMIRA